MRRNRGHFLHLDSSPCGFNFIFFLDCGSREDILEKKLSVISLQESFGGSFNSLSLVMKNKLFGLFIIGLWASLCGSPLSHTFLELLFCLVVRWAFEMSLVFGSLHLLFSYGPFVFSNGLLQLYPKKYVPPSLKRTMS